MSKLLWMLACEGGNSGEGRMASASPACDVIDMLGLTMFWMVCMIRDGKNFNDDKDMTTNDEMNR